MKPTWEKPKTTKVYLHAPGSNRILMLQPEGKITNLALKNEGRHTRQNACGVHMIVGRENPQPLDYHLTRFDTVKDGLPFYTVLGDDPENECKLSMSAFATNDKNPLTYVRITVRNEENYPINGRVGLLPREANNGDQYLTGILDTGYEAYQPNFNQWLLQRIVRFSANDSCNASSTQGAALRILSAEGCDVHWISRDEQTHRFLPHDYFACDYTLIAGTSLSIDFVFCASPIEGCVKSYDEAKADMTAFWQERLSHVKVMPKTDIPRIRDMFLQNVTQCMQMVAQYDGMEGLVVRQGDVGRFLWIWEAVHVLKCLALVGLPEYADIYNTYCSWMTMEGERRGKLNYRYVGWDNAEGALLLGLAEHLKIVDDREQYLHYRPYMMALLDYIDARRNSDPDGKYPGLYPAGQASDWGEIGYHWTFTDAYVLRAIKSYVQVCEKYNAEETAHVRAIAEDYSARIDKLVSDLYAGHENDEAFILPHIAGIDFEDSWNHCFYTDGAPFLNLVGIAMDPCSRMFEQMEAFYRKNGLFEHNLAGRITNATDYGVYAYGDCYYTGISEICWIYPWMKRGEWDKADAMTDAMLRYNVTTEYIVSERYCSIDPWYVPWQPNGSGSGRLCMFLLDYFDNKAKA